MRSDCRWRSGREVVPAERRRRESRDPGIPALRLHNRCRGTWIPDRLALRAVREDSGKRNAIGYLRNKYVAV